MQPSNTSPFKFPIAQRLHRVQVRLSDGTIVDRDETELLPVAADLLLDLEEYVIPAQEGS